MSSSSDHISGLAREIRSAISSEQFDLAGYSEARAKDLVASAFSSPLTEAKSMLRFTFVVGGGKLVRARYDDDLIKWFTTALRDHGFVEDKSAAETFDSQGTYKQQHDTGQNLKYVIVFPRVTVSTDNTANEVKVDSTSPEYIVTACELATFKEIVPIKTVSWRQKKKLLKFLQDSQEEFQAVESKLVSGGLLSSKEQAIYDSNPGNFGEKITFLQSEIKLMVDEGRLTASEKHELVSSLSTNIRSIEGEADSAVGARKKQLEDKKLAAVARKVAVEAISPIQHRLRNGSEIQKLRVRLFPLLALEDKGRSMSLTLADLKTLEEKVDIEASIAQLEMSSRGWFEEEADFKVMCEWEATEAKAKAMRKLAHAPTKGGSTAKASTGKPMGASAGGWSSIGIAKKSSSGPPTSKKTSTGFAAAFDDDSD